VPIRPSGNFYEVKQVNFYDIEDFFMSRGAKMRMGFTAYGRK
jgi:hypothetical protein